MWVGPHLRDVGEGHTRSDHEIEVDGQDDLALDEQIGIEGEGVLGDVDRSLDGVLEGQEGEVGLAVLGGAQHIGECGQWAEGGAGQVGLTQQGLFGERTDRAEEGDGPTGPVDAGGRCCGCGHDGRG